MWAMRPEEQYLKLTLPSGSTLREDVQDEGSAVTETDTVLEGLVQAPQLTGRQLIVQNQRLGPGCLHCGHQLLDLAAPDVRLRVVHVQLLMRAAHYLPHRLHVTNVANRASVYNENVGLGRHFIPICLVCAAECQNLPCLPPEMKQRQLLY